MIRYIKEKEVEQILTMPLAVSAVEAALRARAEGAAVDVPGRAARNEITLYESHGMAIQDLYVGAKILALARERGIGVDLPVGD